MKNPRYDDTRYVTDLVAPGVVNTMPEATLHAVADHAHIPRDSIHGTYPQAHQTLEQLTAHGIDYDDVVATYKTPLVALLEYGLVAAILFHALNGLRIVAVDFWAKGPRYQKQMLWTVLGIWIVLMVGALYPVLGHAVREVFGS